MRIQQYEISSFIDTKPCFNHNKTSEIKNQPVTSLKKTISIAWSKSSVLKQLSSTLQMKFDEKNPSKNQ